MSEHTHADGTVHHHGPGGHTHSASEKRAVVNRLSRAIGHLESIKRMVENDADCSDVLVQLAAVRAAINNAGKLVLKNHIGSCIVEAVEQHDESAIAALNQAIDRFV